MSVEEATATVLELGLTLYSASTLDPTDRIDTFSPLAGAFVELGREITVELSVPAGTLLAGCSP
jgi:hypothetical protein